MKEGTPVEDHRSRRAGGGTLISQRRSPFPYPSKGCPRRDITPWPGTETHHHGLMGTALWSTIWSSSLPVVRDTQCLSLLLLLVHCCVLCSLLFWNLVVDWLASAPIPVFFLSTPYWIRIPFSLCSHFIAQSIGLIASVDHLGVGNKCRSDCWEFHSKYLLLVIVNSGLLSKQFNICGGFFVSFCFFVFFFFLFSMYLSRAYFYSWFSGNVR